MIEEIKNFLEVFDTTIQEKDSINTSEKVEQTLAKLSTVIKNLSEKDIKIDAIGIDQGKLIKYSEFLINSLGTFNLTEEDNEKEILSNSVLPTELSNVSTFSELEEKLPIPICYGGGGCLKLFEYKLIILSPLFWSSCNKIFNSFEEWLKGSGYLALVLKFTNIISDFYDLLVKLNITIPSEGRLRCPKFLVVNTKMIHYLSIAFSIVNTEVEKYDKEKFYKRMASLLNLDETMGEKMIDDAFKVSDSIFQYIDF
jgi:hypothetical protein